MPILVTSAVSISAGEVGVPNANPDATFRGVLNVVYLAAGITAVIIIVIASILYTISEGDSNKVKQARDAILYGVAGLVIIMMAFVITGFVLGKFI